MALSPLRQIAQGSTDATTGQVTYTFETISQGMNAQATVSVPGSAAGIQWDAYVSGTLVGSVEGSSQFGPVFLAGGDVLSLRGTPPAGSDSGPAVIVGSLGLQGEIAPTAPMAGGGFGQTITLLGEIPTTANYATVSPTPTAVSLIITSVENGAPTNSVISVEGATTGTDLNFAPLGSSGQWIAALPGGATDTSFTVTLNEVPQTPVYIWQTTSQATVLATLGGPLTGDYLAVSGPGVIDRYTVPAGTTSYNVPVNVTHALGALNAFLITTLFYSLSAPTVKDFILGVEWPVQAVVPGYVWQATSPVAGTNLNANEFTISVAAAPAQWAITPMTEPIRVPKLPAVQVTVAGTVNAGSDWQWDVPCACKLVAVQFEFNASSQAGNRQPYLWFSSSSGGGDIAQLTTTDNITAGTGNILTGVANGAYYPQPYTYSNRIVFPLPDLVMAPGYSIQTATAGIQSQDQYVNVRVTLELV